jgi:hypothetical protein
MQFSRDERQVFDAPTKMVLGNGFSAPFWEDRWLDGKSMRDIVPELFALINRRPRLLRTVREVLVERTWITDIAGALSPLALLQYVQMWTRIWEVQLSRSRTR